MLLCSYRNVLHTYRFDFNMVIKYSHLMLDRILKYVIKRYMFSHCNEVLISILYQSQPFYHCALAEIEQLGQVRSCDFYRSTPPFS